MKIFKHIFLVSTNTWRFHYCGVWCNSQCMQCAFCDIEKLAFNMIYMINYKIVLYSPIYYQLYSLLDWEINFCLHKMTSDHVLRVVRIHSKLLNSNRNPLNEKSFTRNNSYYIKYLANIYTNHASLCSK